MSSDMVPLVQGKAKQKFEKFATKLLKDSKLRQATIFFFLKKHIQMYSFIVGLKLPNLCPLLWSLRRLVPRTTICAYRHSFGCNLQLFHHLRRYPWGRRSLWSGRTNPGQKRHWGCPLSDYTLSQTLDKSANVISFFWKSSCSRVPLSYRSFCSKQTNNAIFLCLSSFRYLQRTANAKLSIRVLCTPNKEKCPRAPALLPDTSL